MIGCSNLPPGCSPADVERAFGGGEEPTAVEDDVLAALERHDAPQALRDDVLELLGRWQRRLTTPRAAADDRFMWEDAT